MAGRPLSIGPQSGLDRSHSSIPPASTTGPGPAPKRKRHYRPFSSQSSYISIATGQSSRNLRRSVSVGGLHQFCNNMGLQFGSKGRKELVRPNSPAFLPSVMDPPSLRLTKKRSIASIFASDPFAVPPSPSPRCSDELPVINISKNHGSYKELDACHKFTPKDNWAKRCNMKLHPYHRQVPYMQAYDPISLESDRYTHLLFQRLTNGSPSFHDYGKKPPAMVLDLGCGQGHWILHAANVWKHTEFIGLDVVDTTLPAFETAENIRLIRGDFVNYKLPFPDDTFDFVRMANIALCIPYDKWEFVLSQVRRVLTPSGRLELIDDDIYFPYGEGWKGELDPLAPASPLGADELLDMDDNVTMKGVDTENSHPMSPEVPIPVASDLRQCSGLKTFRTPHLVSPSLTRRKDGKLGNSLPPCPKRNKEKVSLLPSIRSITPAFSLHSPAWNLRTANTSPTRSDASSISRTDTNPSTSSVVTTVAPENSVWQKRVSASKNMESLFEKMLVEQYGIHPRPSEFMLRIFGKVFCEDGDGKAQVRMMKNFHIKLAPNETIGDDQSDGGQVGGKERGHGGMEEADGEALTSIGMSSIFSTTVDANSKPQKQNSIPFTSSRSGTWPRQRLKVDQSRTKVEKVKSKQEEHVGRQSKHQKTQAGTVKATATMTVSLFKRSQPRNPVLPTPVRPALSAKAAGILGIPYSELSTVTLSLSISSEEGRSLIMPLPSSFPSNLSAKAAGRLGITYSEALSAAASLSVPRNVVHPTMPSSASTLSPTSSEPVPPSNTTFGPVQHPGLLIWPDTYVPMAAGELEMHACKHIHTLLGCQPALYEFVAKFVDGRGDRFVGEEEFRDEIWEYECFRRARFNWPSEVAEPYEDDPTNPKAGGPSSPVHCTAPNGDAATSGSVDANHPPASTLNLTATSMTGSVSTNGLLPSMQTTHQPCTTDYFGGFSNEMLLRPTKSSVLLRSSSPGQRSPLPSFLPLKTKSKKMYTSRSASPVPSSPLSSSCPRNDPQLFQSMTEGNGHRGHRKVDDFVHLRSIRVFEGIKAA